MKNSIVIYDAGFASPRPPRPTSREDYFIRRRPAELHGRLGYSGQKPQVVGCEIFELSDTAAYVETYAPIDDMPLFFTLEVAGRYHRARLCFADGRKLRLEFFVEELDYVEGA
jgi:hypothetical protein